MDDLVPDFALDLAPDRYTIRRASLRGFEQAYVHENEGGAGPLVLVHGWPESKRIWWRVIEPLAAAGFEVIAPDLRGFGDSDVAPDGFHDVPSHSRDLHALVHDHLGHERAVLVGGDLGGPVIQDVALRFPGFVPRMVLFNSPLPFDKQRMRGMRTRPAIEASDYFVRQGTDPDGLAGELHSADMRQRYIATFYTSRFWAHPGAFTSTAGGAPPGRFGGSAAVDFHTEPFADGAKLRASFGGYESVFSERARSEPPVMAVNDNVEVLILFGTSDHVLYPDFDRMAAVVFPDHVGPFLLRDCGHFVPWEAPRQLVSGVRSLCRDLISP
ncbi:MAG TPA: alpha/beta hydrolase [Acidimicrobiales bacterium]|jgi:pimeloyl-ACP methyl ester carboxylesterase